MGWAEIRAQSSHWLLQKVVDAKVIVIRGVGSGPTLENFTRLMERLGRPVPHPLDNFTVPGRRNVLVLSNLYRNGQPAGVHEGGTYWHTDMSYKAQNQVLTGLLSVAVPAEPSASATEFVDCEIGNHLTGEWEDLGQVSVVHCFGNRQQAADPAARAQSLSSKQMAGIGGAVTHPLLLVHPVTRRMVVYGAAATSVKLSSADLDESQRRLDALLGRILATARHYTHHYRPGDVVIWDNLSTLHRGHEIPKTEDPSNCRLLYRMNVDYS